jgi:excisionase family DNA binding protein
VSKSEAITPLSITDRTCDALAGLAPRGWRKALVAMQVPHAKVGGKTICRSDDWLAAISHQAGAGPLVAPDANPTATPLHPPRAKSQTESDDEWMQQVLLPALADQDRRRRERAAGEAVAAIVALDTLLIENFETNGLTLGTLKKWIREGRLPSQKVGRAIKVARSDVAPLLAEWKRTARR